MSKSQVRNEIRKVTENSTNDIKQFLIDELIGNGYCLDILFLIINDEIKSQILSYYNITTDINKKWKKNIKICTSWNERKFQHFLEVFHIDALFELMFKTYRIDYNNSMNYRDYIIENVFSGEKIKYVNDNYKFIDNQNTYYWFESWKKCNKEKQLSMVKYLFEEIYYEIPMI